MVICITQAGEFIPIYEFRSESVIREIICTAFSNHSRSPKNISITNPSDDAKSITDIPISGIIFIGKKALRCYHWASFSWVWNRFNASKIRNQISCSSFHIDSLQVFRKQRASTSLINGGGRSDIPNNHLKIDRISFGVASGFRGIGEPVNINPLNREKCTLLSFHVINLPF